MTKLVLEDATANGSLGASKPAQALPSQANPRQQVVNNVLGSIATVQAEVDDVLADMKVFSKFEPDQVMSAVSAHSARLLEIVVQIGRIEVVRREWKPVREECDRVLGQLKEQFAIASRLQAVREADWNMSGRGQP